MRKHRIERNLAFPTEEFRARVRTAARERGFRSEQAFILTACENELRRDDGVEATTQLEARIAATLVNLAKEVQSLFSLGHTQFAIDEYDADLKRTVEVNSSGELIPVAVIVGKLQHDSEKPVTSRSAP
jgi:hypothetical protein